MSILDEPGLIPYVIQREGEEAALANLVIRAVAPGRQRLFYTDDDPRDRDLHGVLWARCSFSPVDEFKRPTGTPQWKLMHPFRQRITMQAMRCQVCAERARTPVGFVFLAGPGDLDPDATPVLTNQPPVCATHVRAAARLCPHLADNPIVFLARGASLYGVIGTIYGYGDHGVHVVAQPDAPLSYGHPNLSTCLASQLIRRLSSFRVLDMKDLQSQVGAAAA
ncbi:hypothetical protein ACWCQN_45110 [Streptomyces sp. NPDC001984]